MDFRPPSVFGLLERLQVFREQAVSLDYHRYDNLGRRARLSDRGSGATAIPSRTLQRGAQAACCTVGGDCGGLYKQMSVALRRSG